MSRVGSEAGRAAATPPKSPDAPVKSTICSSHELSACTPPPPRGWDTLGLRSPQSAPSRRQGFCAYQEATPFSLSSPISSPFGGCILPCAPLEIPPMCQSALAVCKPQVLSENSGGSAAVSKRREINKKSESVANSSTI
ncbi:hypothetical protein E2C01_046047 [Portunus trituberculatus]|uniref:Uncharacterized protein n=1 Tax=Portunus trituberculatus TaxID=210409 RepID=A0A5B7G413_PORTR|nr:hypothetical protein [Portunus trituberculatus]